MAHIFTYEWHGSRFDARVDEAKCRASVSDSTGFRSNQCGRKPKVRDAEGLGWCTQHSPEAVAARRAKREAKWKAESDQFNRKILISRVGRAFVVAMEETGDVLAAGDAAARAMGGRRA